jgi:hypothetical protein
MHENKKAKWKVKSNQKGNRIKEEEKL